MLIGAKRFGQAGRVHLVGDDPHRATAVAVSLR
jgi:hypothetical protein